MKINSFIDSNKLALSLKKFNKAKPFPYCIIDNFLNKKLALKIEKNFPHVNDKKLYNYNNYCEIKKATDNWKFFPGEGYQLISILNSFEFLNIITKSLKIKNLYADYGLNGGGFHIMGHKGKLNPHLDYVIHPKMKLMRKFNLIIFFNTNWKEENGGELCFYGKNKKNKKMPGKLITKISPKFNRAVLFDTSMSSWHSVNEINKSIRKSIATYYLVSPKGKIEKRYKALYAPTKDQINNKKVKKFIELRSKLKSAFKVANVK